MLTKLIIENLLIIFGESFMLFASVAQLLRIIQTRDTAGLSAVTSTLYAAGNVAWMTYFARLHLWLPFATNATNLLVTTVAVAYILRDRRQFGHGVMTIVTVGPLTGLALIAFTGVSGWIGFAYGMIAGTPYIVRIVRHKKVSGISEHSLLLALSSMVLVLIYAVLVHAPPLLASCVQGLLYEAIAARYYYRYRPHS